MLTQCFMLGRIIRGYSPWKLWQKCHRPGSAMAPWSIVSRRLRPCRVTLTQKSCRPLCSEWWFCRDSSSPDINQHAVRIHGHISEQTIQLTWHQLWSCSHRWAVGPCSWWGSGTQTLCWCSSSLSRLCRCCVWSLWTWCVYHPRSKERKLENKIKWFSFNSDPSISKPSIMHNMERRQILMGNTGKHAASIGVSNWEYVGSQNAKHLILFPKKSIKISK